MKKVFILLLLVLQVAAVAFASGSTEETKAWFNADKVADQSVKYVATQRSATISLSNGEELTATAQYKVNNSDLLTRVITGDKDVFTLLDTYSYGYILTPFEDDIILLDKEYLGKEVVNGINCLVFDCDVAVYESIFFKGKDQGGELLGEDEGETDSSVNIKVYISEIDNTIVKEVITYEELPFLTDLSLNQEVIFQTNNGINTPESVITTGHYRANGAKNFSVFDVYDFVVMETLSGYTYMNSYTHE